MYSVREIAELWGLSDRRIREMCTKGMIAGVQKVGKSYLIPKDAQKPERKKRKVEIVKNEICLVCKEKGDFVASALLYNFFCNDQKVDTNIDIVKLDKKISYHKLDIKTISRNIENSDYKCVVFIGFFDKTLYKNLENTQYVYIGKNQTKCYTLNQVVGFKNCDVSKLSNLAQRLISIEGVHKQIYDIVCNVIDGKYILPITFNFNNIDYVPKLIYRLPTIQKGYEFLAKQYDSFEEGDEFFTVNIGNQVEFSDSNQELDYAVKIINAQKRNVAVNFIYIYDKNNIKKFCKHFTTKIYLQNLNSKSAFYLVDRNTLDKAILHDIDQGVILYKNNGVYHDAITEYSLGYVNANKDHTEKYYTLVQKLIQKGKKICSNEAMEEFYELQK